MMRTDNWSDSILDKLRQVGRIAKSEQAQAVLDGGDFFHITYPKENSHSLIRRTMEVHKDYPCPVYANIGNHDCIYGKYEYIDQQPLGVLFEAGTFKRCYDGHEAIFENSGVKVRVVGVPFHGNSYDMDRLYSIKKGNEDYLVVMAHLLASAEGGSMFKSEDIIKYSDLVKVDADVFAFGHWHKNQGIVEIAPSKWVVNVGSLSRGSLSQDNTERIPVCVKMGFSKESLELTEIPLKVAPASEIFDIEAKSVAKARQAVMEDFEEILEESMNPLKAETSLEVQLEDKIKSVKDINHEVKQLVLLWMEKAQSAQ